jgi:hypothetical protein
VNKSNHAVAEIVFLNKAVAAKASDATRKDYAAMIKMPARNFAVLPARTMVKQIVGLHQFKNISR